MSQGTIDCRRSCTTPPQKQPHICSICSFFKPSFYGHWLFWKQCTIFTITIQFYNNCVFFHKPFFFNFLSNSCTITNPFFSEMNKFISHINHHLTFNFDRIPSVKSFFRSFHYPMIFHSQFFPRSSEKSHVGVIFCDSISIARPAKTICFVNSSDLSIRENYRQIVYQKSSKIDKPFRWLYL